MVTLLFKYPEMLVTPFSLTISQCGVSKELDSVRVSVFGNMVTLSIFLLVSWVSMSNSLIESISSPQNSNLIGLSKFKGKISKTKPRVAISPVIFTVVSFR